MEKALSIKNLKKTYKGGLEAVKGIDLEIEKGDFFALLGPNGAGKTTTINIIMNLVNKTEGKVEVFGYDIDKDADKAKALIGFTPQEFNFEIFEKVFDIIVRQAGYYGIEKKIAKKRAEKYLKQLGLWNKRNDQARTLSGGLKRRLMIARALVHEPKLLILDEPTAGVDIETRREMWEFIKDLNKKGTTIILTTHYLEEAENLCRNIAIIDKGRIIENTSMKNFLSKMDKDTLVFEVEKKIGKIPQLENHKIKIIDETTIEIEILKKQNLNKLFDYFKKNKIQILGMRRKTARLEELFLNLVKKNKNEI